MTTYTALPSGRPVRWGVLATGSIARTVTDDMLTIPDDCQVVAVGSRSLDHAREFAAERAIGQAFGSYEELASCPDVDVVYVATPHSHHLEAARLCLEAGKHVLCEKPLTPEPETTEELLRLAEERGVFLMEGVWTRCNPIIRQAKEMVADGSLGEVVRVSANFDVSWDGPDSHRMVNPELAGGGILDLGVYPIHVMNLLLGEPDELVSAGRLHHTGVDSHAEALLAWKREGGRPVIGHASCSLEGNTPMELVIVGTEGRLVVEGYLRPDHMTLTRPDGSTREWRTNVPGNGYTFELQEVANCLRQGLVESPLVPWESTREASRTMATWRRQLGIPGFSQK